MKARMLVPLSVFAILILALIEAVDAQAPLLLSSRTPGKRSLAGVYSPQQQAENVEFVGQIGGSTEAVAVQGNYAYLGVGPRLMVLNVSDPANPRKVGQTAVLPDLVQDVYATGNYAYVADGDLRVIDVSIPAAPAEVGFYDTLGYARDVYVAGNYAYVADGDLRVIDVSIPAAPAEVGFYDTPRYALDVYVTGNYAYVTDGDGLRVGW